MYPRYAVALEKTSALPESMADWQAVIAPSMSPWSSSRRPRLMLARGAASGCPESIAQW
jgi:hypothetical protein